MELAGEGHELKEVKDGSVGSEESVDGEGGEGAEGEDEPACRTLQLSDEQKREAEPRLTVGPKRLAVGRADAEDGGDEDVLEGRDEEEGRVLERDDVELVGVNLGRDVPAREN